MTELERALVALGGELEFPQTPDLTSRVRERLGSDRRGVRPRLLFAAAVVALAVGVAMAVPPARSAILKFFHLGSATVERVETLPPAQQRPLTAGLGPALVREDAEMAAGFGIRLPQGAAPQRFYAQPGMISTLVRADGKPVLLSELQGDQMGLFKKFASPATSVQPVQLGEFGLLIRGGPHVLMWERNFGPIHRIETRLAGNVVLWLVNGTTYRLEGRLDKGQMLHLARRITR
jgi:hypothetical protein